MAEAIKRPTKAEGWEAFSRRLAAAELTAHEVALGLATALEEDWPRSFHPHVAGAPRENFSVRVQDGLVVVRALTDTANGWRVLDKLARAGTFGGPRSSRPPRGRRVSLPIYVAAASREIGRAWFWMQEIRETPGLEIVEGGDWTRRPRPNPVDLGTRVRCANEDVEAVRRAAVLWLLAPELPTAGAWVKLGVAVEARRNSGTPGIVVSGPGSMRSIFCALADREFETDREALLYLNAIAAET